MYFTFCISTLNIIELISRFLNKLSQTVGFIKFLFRDFVAVPNILTAFIPWIFQPIQTHAAKE